jgi:hypothetical protein
MSFCHKSPSLSTGSFPIFEGVERGIFGAKGKMVFLSEKHLTFCCGHDTVLTIHPKAETKTVRFQSFQRAAGWCEAVTENHRTHHFRAGVPKITEVLPFARVKG